MASIRFIRNINLKVNFEGEESMVPFAAGAIYTVIRIEVDTDGFNDIHMPDGSVIKGVASDPQVFENMGQRVPVTRVTQVEAVPENQEIEVEETPVETALLDGQMRSSSEETDDEYDREPFTAPNE